MLFVSATPVFARRGCLPICMIYWAGKWRLRELEPTTNWAADPQAFTLLAALWWASLLRCSLICFQRRCAACGTLYCTVERVEPRVPGPTVVRWSAEHATHLHMAPESSISFTAVRDILATRSAYQYLAIRGIFGSRVPWTFHWWNEVSNAFALQGQGGRRSSLQRRDLGSRRISRMGTGQTALGSVQRTSLGMAAQGRRTSLSGPSQSEEEIATHTASQMVKRQIFQLVNDKKWVSNEFTILNVY
uniref:Uncharacterized protein n=1 Tax=Trichuris muris TaxID=70415 RepID=A0A5S6QBG7_TRIMR